MKCPKCGKNNPDNAQECQWAFCRFDFSSKSPIVSQSVSAQLKFPKIPSVKLISLSITTFGLYDIVWMYWHWAAIKRIEGSSILLAPRAFFGAFFSFSLFRKYDKYLRNVDDGLPVGSAILAICYFLTTVFTQLPGLWLWLSLLRVIPLWLVQSSVNRISISDEETINGWHKAIVVIGGAFVVSGILVDLFPEDFSE